MAVGIIFLLAVGVATAAPPAPPRYYQQGPAQIQGHPLDYFLDNQEVANYYQEQQRPGPGQAQASAPARLENLEPDSEVELVPGVQPQQPPQQNPVAPNAPGLLPGQRVYIVHMPVAGVRPGSIGGYQPIYIVAAAPQGNTGYPANVNGYQNTIYLDPQSGQVVGYQQPGVVPQANPAYFAGPGAYYNRPQDFLYQGQSLGFQPGVVPQQPQQPVAQSPLRFSQLVPLQQPQRVQLGNTPRNVFNESLSAEPKRVGQASESIESKEGAEESRRNARPNPAQTQARKS